MRILTYPVQNLPPLQNYVLLSPDGPQLTLDDAECGLLLLDSAWRRIKGLLPVASALPKRSLRGFHTAFPRVSKLGTDPEEGLASVEALYVAYHILGRPTAGLLNHYLWRDEFLRLNGIVENDAKTLNPPAE